MKAYLPPLVFLLSFLASAFHRASYRQDLSILDTTRPEHIRHGIWTQLIPTKLYFFLSSGHDRRRSVDSSIMAAAGSGETGPIEVSLAVNMASE